MGSGREVKFEERYFTKGSKSWSSSYRVKKKEKLSPLSAKSDRSIEDSNAPMGMGATNTLERMAARFAQLKAEKQFFFASLVVQNAGFLCPLPALLGGGFWSRAGKFF